MITILILFLFFCFIIEKIKTNTGKKRYPKKYIRWEIKNNHNEIEEYCLHYNEINFSVLIASILPKNNNFLVSLNITIPSSSDLYKENKLINETKKFSSLDDAYKYSDNLQQKISEYLSETNYFKLLYKKNNILIFK